MQRLADTLSSISTCAFSSCRRESSGGGSERWQIVRPNQKESGRGGNPKRDKFVFAIYSCNCKRHLL